MASRQPSLKLDKEKGAITNLKGEVIYVRRTRQDGGEIYVAPSSETAICVQTQQTTERVGTNWDGDRCTSAEDMTVEICVDFAVEKPKTAPKKAGQITSDVGDL